MSKYPSTDVEFARMDLADVTRDVGGKITAKGSTISFTIQDGPIKEVGFNGVQIDRVIEFAANLLRIFNKKSPCRENSCAITHLDEAMMWLEKRTKDRTERKVEGTDQK